MDDVTDLATEVAAPTAAAILFYCRSCKKIIADPVRKGSKYEYSCPECKEDRVAFGTEKAICDFFQINPPKKNA